MLRTIGKVKAGRTAPIILYLQEDDQDIDGTGLTVSDVILTGIDGQAIDTAGKFEWEEQDEGSVSYSPASSDFVPERSPYRISVKLTDGTGKVRYYPEEFTAEIVVSPVRA